MHGGQPLLPSRRPSCHRAYAHWRSLPPYAFQCAATDTDGARQRDPSRDVANYDRTRAALDAVGLSGAEQSGVARILLAILALGNVSFGEGDEAKARGGGVHAHFPTPRSAAPTHPLRPLHCVRTPGSAALFPLAQELLVSLAASSLSFTRIVSSPRELSQIATADATQAVHQAAALLGLEDVSHLSSGMCQRRLKAGSEWVTTANTVAQASEVRHALAKQLYSYLFLWLVSRINTALAKQPEDSITGAPYAGGTSGPHIAYVDIFGFEIFETNSLEQVRQKRA